MAHNHRFPDCFVNFPARTLRTRTRSKSKPNNTDAFISITAGLLDVEQRIGESNLDTEDEELGNDSEVESTSDNESD